LSVFNIDTIKEIAKVNKWETEFIETDWAGFTAGLDSGRFDISVVPTFVTVPRALSVYFTKPMFFAGNSAIVRANETRFSNLASIDKAGITVAVTQGEAGDEYAKANFKNAKITSFTGGDQSLAFQAVASNRADIALGDAYVSGQFAKANAGKVKDLFANAPYNLTPVAWAVKKGDDKMLNFLNSSLESFDYQGRLLEWEKKAGANWLHIEKVWEFTTAKN
jgi:ABC-type amino acid transport substrate-binding protein